MEKIIFYTIPIYNIAILIEYIYTKAKMPKTYNLKDTAASLTMGIGFLMVSGLSNLFILPIFIFLNKHSIFNIPNTWSALFFGQNIVWWAFLLLLFAEDFCYYWFHRISHTCRLFWCAHETHHSSEYYNFGTALRQTWLGSPLTWIFWLPLAIIGFRAEDILFQMTVNLFYQFWVHTRTTKSFGFLNHILNTPSHHRVHHGSNIIYLDKNYAGIFIIWDKIFGTFMPEQIEPTYGVLHPLNSYNPFFIGLHTIKDLYKDIKRSDRLRDKICYLFYPPGWNHEGTGKTSKVLQRELNEKLKLF